MTARPTIFIYVPPNAVWINYSQITSSGEITSDEGGLHPPEPAASQPTISAKVDPSIVAVARWAGVHYCRRAEPVDAPAFVNVPAEAEVWLMLLHELADHAATDVSIRVCQVSIGAVGRFM